MKIILSTYAFYPYASGGTEVYTSAMAEYLHNRGHQVLIVAGWSGDANAGEALVWHDDEIKAGLYQYRSLQVLGVQLMRQNAEAVYANEKGAWSSAFKEILAKIGWGDTALLLMNGVSAVSGLSLFKSLEQLNPQVKLSVIVHTPFVCAKADMIFARTGTRCQQIIAPAACAACVTATSTRLPFAFSGLLNRVANTGIFSALSKSAFFRQHRLLQTKIAGLQWLNEKANYWIVFSNDMRLFLEKQRFIKAATIKVIRHGIDKSIFYLPAVKPAPTPHSFLYAGRFEAVKGVELLCDAWKKLPEDTTLRQLYLAGNWQQTATGRAIHKELGHRRDVVFMEGLTQGRLADLYRQVHCVVVPSRWVETGPLVIHEAIACGCDIISSNIGGQAELAALYTGKSHVFDLLLQDSLYRLLLNYQPSGMKPAQMPWSASSHFDAVAEAIAIAG